MSKARLLPKLWPLRKNHLIWVRMQNIKITYGKIW